MNRLQFNDGRLMPQVGLGIWQVPSDEAAQVVRQGIETGYRLIDGAAIYHNERGLGQGVRDSGVARDELFVTSKLWNADQGYDATLKAFEATMARTGLDYLDLYLIHWPLPSRDLYVETWKALIRLRDEGRIRSIGVSNHGPEHIARLIEETGVTPVLNQIELHPALQQRETRAFHNSHGIITQSWSPLGRQTVIDDPVITAIAARQGKTPAQIILRWHVDSGLSVIPKSVRPERQRENLAILDFSLTEDDMSSIASIDRNERIGPDPATFDMVTPIDD